MSSFESFNIEKLPARKYFLSSTKKEQTVTGLEPRTT